MGLLIRAARPSDAAEISDVLIRSITELCWADHGGRPANIADWTDTKTPDHIAGWIAAGHALFVTEENGCIGAVGQFNAKGLIQLLYVSPDARGMGHSAALLADMEKRIVDNGLTEARLVSTKTAQVFYENNGWQADGPTEPCHRGDGQPMRKRLKA